MLVNQCYTAISPTILFQDRFAEGRFEPGIDASQDWYLTSHLEKDGWTVLEFTRALMTCDDKYDLDITVSY